MLKGYHLKGVVECGCDEAGRGCLAGPVVAAAVIFPEGFTHAGITDSKALNEQERKALRRDILDHAIAAAIGICSSEEIDAINILRASFRAMHKAISGLDLSPQHLLIDGNRFDPYPGIPHTCIIKGDSKYLSIAAASILAKTERDAIMQQWHERFPHYNWKKNKGYPTADHRSAILRHGLSPLHRRSFRQLPLQTSLDFEFIPKQSDQSGHA